MHIVSKVVSQSLCVWPRNSLHLLEEGQNHQIVRLTYLCHMISQEFDLLSFLYINLFELGPEINFYKGSAVAQNKVNLLKKPHWSICSSALMMFLRCSFASAYFTSSNQLSLSVVCLNSNVYKIRRALLIATPSGHLPQKQFMKKDTTSRLYRLSFSSLPDILRCGFLEILLVPTVCSCYLMCKMFINNRKS